LGAEASARFNVSFATWEVSLGQWLKDAMRR
jgi:hypothetical protein